MAQKNVLGKGLGAIFPDLINNESDKKKSLYCGIEELHPNRYQPRKTFHDDKPVSYTHLTLPTIYSV